LFTHVTVEPPCITGFSSLKPVISDVIVELPSVGSAVAIAAGVGSGVDVGGLAVDGGGVAILAGDTEVGVGAGVGGAVVAVGGTGIRIGGTGVGGGTGVAVADTGVAAKANGWASVGRGTVVLVGSSVGGTVAVRAGIWDGAGAGSELAPGAGAVSVQAMRTTPTTHNSITDDLKRRYVKLRPGLPARSGSTSSGWSPAFRIRHFLR
jgi:hypothetical protein